MWWYSGSKMAESNPEMITPIGGRRKTVLAM
jgi:hypothetical protein